VSAQRAPLNMLNADPVLYDKYQSKKFSITEIGPSASADRAQNFVA